MHVPRALDRDVWRQWSASFAAGPDAAYPFLRDVAAEIGEVLSGGRYDVPLAVELEPADFAG